MTYYCIKNVNETRTLKSGLGVIETIIFNTRGAAGSKLDLYDDTDADDSNLVASFDIENVDNLIQYFPHGLEFERGLTYVTSGDPGNITITYR